MSPKRFVLPFLCLALADAPAFAQTAPDATVHVDITAAHQINSFDPDSALGSSLDVLSHRDIDRVHTPHIVQESLSAGWGPITYRNNSELRMAAWHWNPEGAWSDAAAKAATSPAASISNLPSATFCLTRSLIADSPPAATVPYRARISSTGKAILTSPPNSPANPIRSTRNGSSPTSAQKNKSTPRAFSGPRHSQPPFKSNTGSAPTR